MYMCMGANRLTFKVLVVDNYGTDRRSIKETEEIVNVFAFVGDITSRH